jgi:hypothetical protein
MGALLVDEGLHDGPQAGVGSSNEVHEEFQPAQDTRLDKLSQLLITLLYSLLPLLTFTFRCEQRSSVADPGIIIPDPRSWFLSIVDPRLCIPDPNPDLWSNNTNRKDVIKKFVVLPLISFLNIGTGTERN